VNNALIAFERAAIKNSEADVGRFLLPAAIPTGSGMPKPLEI
jgi:hypothetical protein